MSSSKEHFEKFEDHTLLKHAILKAYVAAWAFKLLHWRKAGDTLFFVDGFAGAGKDEEGHHGSPLIAGRIARVVQGHFAKISGRGPVRIRVIAVEASASHYKQLTAAVAGFVKTDADSVLTRPGSVSDHIDEIVGVAGGAPTLFFLDPFGLKGLDATSYPKMLAGQHNEIFALFSDIGAARLRGVLSTRTGLEDRIQSLRESLSLFDQDREEADALEATARAKLDARARYTAPARAAITKALGNDASWEQGLDGLPGDEVREGLIRRFRDLLHKAGARYVLVFAMRGTAGEHKYCMLHASQSVRGFTAMKEAVSAGLNSDELSLTMREQMKEDLRLPMELVKSELLRRFAGQRLNWTGKKGEDAGTVRRALLDETGVFDFQCVEIRKALKELGWLHRDGVDMCDFPKTD